MFFNTDPNVAATIQAKFPFKWKFIEFYITKKKKNRERKKENYYQWETFSCIYNNGRMFTLSCWIYLKELESEDEIKFLDTDKSWMISI